MATQTSVDPAASVISAEDVARAGVYRLLAGVLSGPPSAEALSQLAGLRGDRSPFGEAIAGLSHTAETMTAAACAEEYQDLFIGLGRGEVVPFASYYLTGFLQEKPLAKLRDDMAALGLERSPDVAEPEDHAASVLEIMAGLIDGGFSSTAGITDKAFYERHIGSWMRAFFADLTRARTARLYVDVGAVGRAFLTVEEAAFSMS